MCSARILGPLSKAIGSAASLEASDIDHLGRPLRNRTQFHQV